MILTDDVTFDIQQQPCGVILTRCWRLRFNYRRASVDVTEQGGEVGLADVYIHYPLPIKISVPPPVPVGRFDAVVRQSGGYMGDDATFRKCDGLVHGISPRGQAK